MPWRTFRFGAVARILPFVLRPAVAAGPGVERRFQHLPVILSL